MTEIRNILIIGRTRNGKSSLANTLVNKEGNFQEVFKESSRSVSKTKKSQGEVFEWKEIEYRVVDTIGLGDSKLSDKEVLYNIAETIGMMKDGISHVLFVIKDTFTPEEKENFKLLRDVMFESHVTPYVTIVRTNFEAFRNNNECEEDKQELIEESEDIKDIIVNCNGFIHVDNPSLKIIKPDDGDVDEKEREENEKKIAFRTKSKNKSREKILDHLKSNYRGNYKLKAWDKIHLKINNYLDLIKKGLQADLVEKEKEIIIEQVAVIIQKEIPSVAKQQEVKKSWRWCNIL